LTLELCDKVTAVVDPLKNGNKAAGTTERGINRDNAPFSMPRSLMFAATAPAAVQTPISQRPGGAQWQSKPDLRNALSSIAP
jgi:hypothetical protein